MRQHLAGMLTARETARIISVHLSTVLRLARDIDPGFDWQEARLEYVHRVTARYQPPPPAPLSDDSLPY